MKNKIVLTKDGQKCEIRMAETNSGMKMNTHGKGCKKVLGKDYFDEMKMEFKDE